MPGNIRNPITDIELIRDNLRDRYGSGFPILKELLQNGDDAGASRVDLGWHPGFPDSKHPLLRTPGLFVCNDALFRKEDAARLREFGVGAKRGDETAIGKFGLGLKSAFHLCEAFFYLGPPPADQQVSSVKYADVYNPWSDGSDEAMNADWDVFEEEEQARIKSALASLLPGNSWFCLWIPLRCRTHSESPIMEEYPGEDAGDLAWLFSEQTWRELGLLMPMLSTVRSLAGWKVIGNELKEQWHVDVPPACSQRRFPHHQLNGTETLSGSVQTLGPAGSSATSYNGKEREQWTPELENLHRSPKWPKYTEKENRRPVSKPHKGRPHGAVLFNRAVRATAGAGNLRIRWSVFLPVGDEVWCQEPLASKGDIDIFLHGYFFIDAGRKHVEGIESTAASNGPADEKELRMRWNKGVAEQCTLSLFLETLVVFCQGDQLPHDQQKDLVSAIQRSKLFTSFKGPICAKFQLVSRLTPSGPAWCLEDSSCSLYELPATETSLLRSLFEGFDGITQRYLFAFQGEPRLRSSEHCVWTSEIAADWLMSISKESLGDAKAREYLKTLCNVALSQIKFSWNDALRILGHLGSILPSAANAVDWAWLPIFIFAKAEPLPAGWEKQIEDLNLFCFREIDQSDYKFTSWKSLQPLLQKGLLFLDSAGTELAKALGNAIGTSEIGFLHWVGGASLQSSLRLGVCDVATSWRAVLASSTLGDATSRKGLFSKLLHCEFAFISPELKKALRYLLHASQTQIESQHSLFIRTLKSEAKGWQDLIEALLKHREEPWRLVAADFDLNQRELDWLEIKRSERDPALTLTRETDLAKLDLESLPEEDLRFLLRELPEDLARALPIHRHTTGKLHPVDDVTFLETDFKPDAELESVWRQLLQSAKVVTRLTGVELARQKELMPELDWNSVIQLALLQPEPHAFCKAILVALKILGTPRQSVGQRLKMVQWIQLFGDALAAPNEIIAVEGADKEIERLFKNKPGACISVRALPDEITVHPGYPALRQQLPRRQEALDMLAKELRLRPGLRLGLSALASPAELEDFLGVFQTCPAEVMPVGDLLQAVCVRPGAKTDEKAEALQSCLETLIPALAGPLPPANYVSVFGHIKQHHQASPHPQRSTAIRVFNRYLGAAVALPSFSDEVLLNIELLNQLKQWRQAGQLIVPTLGVAKAEQVDEEQAAILFRASSAEDSAAGKDSDEVVPAAPWGEVDLEDSARKIRSYFERFEDLVPRELIGALIALFGDETTLLPWAKQLLGAFNVELVRDELVPPAHVVGGRGVRKALPTVRFVCEVIRGESVELPSLTGKPISVRVATEFESFLFGEGMRPLQSIRTSSWTSGPCHRLVLVEAQDAIKLPANELGGLLKQTVYHILRTVYCLRSAHIEDLWQKLQRSEQVDIRIAQRLVLNAGDFYLAQLGYTNHPALRENLKLWREAKELEAQTEEAGRPDSQVSQMAQQVREKARRQLKEMLENVPDVQRILLEAVRRKMRAFQYDPESIPFELFQNADDAYVELERMGIPLEKGDPARAPVFVIRLAQDKLTFAHWGRAINQYRHGSFEAGPDLGFNRDLQKMLTLSSSDKEEATLDSQNGATNRTKVTGKFGLGFKSIFLASANPRVLSARLAFEVVAGFYPKRLDGEPLASLKSSLEILRPEQGGQGSCFELALDAELGLKPEGIIQSFDAFAEIQLIFSRRIKSYSLIDAAGHHHPMSWAEMPVSGATGCFFGKLRSCDGAHGALVVRVPDSPEFCVLFTLDERGFKALSPSTPSIWVTAPTREKLKCGFALNGPFEPDVGRLQLARDSEKNRSLAQKAGTALGTALGELAVFSETDWKGLAQEIGLAETTDRRQFWLSLWNLVMGADCLAEANANQSAANDALRVCIWGEQGCGYLHLIKSHKVLPTGLKEQQDTFTCLNDIQFEITGALDDSAELFSAVSLWRGFISQIPAGSAVSSKRVMWPLTKFAPAGALSEAEEVTLWQAIDLELQPARHATPEIAERLGAVVDKKLIKSIEEGKLGSVRELSELRIALSNVEFLAEDGRYHPAKELACKRALRESISDDEGLRACFAPAHRRLSSLYSPVGISFFAIARGELRASVEDLAGWAEQADGESLQAVLAYLEKGELRFRLMEKLGAVWLNRVKQTPEFQALPGNSKAVVSWLGDSPTVTGKQVTPPPPPVPEKALERIYDWWSRERDRWTAVYEQRVYPNGQAPSFRPEDALKIIDESGVRRNWLVLLMLGSMHTIGYSSTRFWDGQNRNFLELFVRKNWLDRLASVGNDHCIQILDEYLADPVERPKYFEWMKQFVSFYQSGKWLQQYVWAFLEADKASNPRSIWSILNSRANPELTGSGLDTPPLDRALGLGGCFVIRELKRAGFLTNPHLDKHCYTPKARIRALMGSCGCTFPEAVADASWSGSIHDFLVNKLGAERARFLGSYDLPFEILANNDGARAAVFGQTFELPSDES
jgi:hypothetical protein